MTPRTLLSLLTLATGCGEAGLTTFNLVPSATITWPASGAQVDPGPLTLLGTVSDGDHTVDQLAASWSVGGAVVCDGLTPDDQGQVRCDVTLLPGETDATITLSVEDPDLAGDLARVDVAISDPWATGELGDGAWWYEGPHCALPDFDATLGHPSLTLAADALDVDVTTIQTWPVDLQLRGTLFLALSQATFTPDQITAIEAYLEDGGVLVLVGDNTSLFDPTAFNGLLEALGVSSRFDPAAPDLPSQQALRVNPGHPAVTDVQVASVTSPGALLPGGPEDALARVDPVPVVIAAEGRVVLLADTELLTRDTGDHAVLLENLLLPW